MLKLWQQQALTEFGIRYHESREQTKAWLTTVDTDILLILGRYVKDERRKETVFQEIKRRLTKE